MLIYMFISLVFSLIPLFLVGYIVYRIVRKNKQGQNSVNDEFKYIRFPEKFLPTLALLLILHQVFFFNVTLGIGVSVFLASAMALIYYLLPKEKKTVLTKCSVLVGILASLMLFIRANGAVQSINLVFIFVTILLLLLIYSSDRIVWKGLFLIKLVGDYFYTAFHNIIPLIKYRKKHDAKLKVDIVSLIKTLLFTVIVVFIFTQILSSADLVFSDIVADLMSQFYDRALSMILLSILLVILLTIYIPADKNKELKLSFFKYMEIIVPSLAVVILFGVFIAIQIKYLFIGHTDLTSFGFSYSEYARKGFMELIVGTLLGGALVYFIYLKQQTLESASQVRNLMLVNTALVVELFVLLASAAKRDLMYINVFDLTRTRLLGIVILLWLLAVLAVLFLINLYRGKLKEQTALLVISLVTVVLLGSINILNIDSIIANYTSSGATTNNIDYLYIASLSEDAADSWTDITEKMQSRLGVLLKKSPLSEQDKNDIENIHLALVQILERIDYLGRKYGYQDKLKMIQMSNNSSFDNVRDWERVEKWQSFNLSEYTAARMIFSDDAFIYKVPRLLNDIYDRFSEDTMQQNQPDLLYSLDRPFIKNLGYGEYNYILEKYTSFYSDKRLQLQQEDMQEEFLND